MTCSILLILWRNTFCNRTVLKVVTWFLNSGGLRPPIGKEAKKEKMDIFISSLLFYPLSVLSVPKADTDYLFVHLHSNRSTGGEVRFFLSVSWLFSSGFSRHPSTWTWRGIKIPQDGRRYWNVLGFVASSFGMHYMLEPIYYRLCLQPMSVNYDFTFQGGIGGSYLDLFELSNLPYSACPRECPAINSPVCGLNGKTYGSKCLLRRVSIFFFRKYWKNYKWMNTIDVYIFVLTCQNLISVSKATSL